MTAKRDAQIKQELMLLVGEENRYIKPSQRLVTTLMNLMKVTLLPQGVPD